MARFGIAALCIRRLLGDAGLGRAGIGDARIGPVRVHTGSCCSCGPPARRRRQIRRSRRGPQERRVSFGPPSIRIARGPGIRPSASGTGPRSCGPTPGRPAPAAAYRGTWATRRIGPRFSVRCVPSGGYGTCIGLDISRAAVPTVFCTRRARLGLRGSIGVCGGRRGAEWLRHRFPSARFGHWKDPFLYFSRGDLLRAGDNCHAQVKGLELRAVALDPLVCSSGKAELQAHGPGKLGRAHTPGTGAELG